MRRHSALCYASKSWSSQPSDIPSVRLPFSTNSKPPGSWLHRTARRGSVGATTRSCLSRSKPGCATASCVPCAAVMSRSTAPPRFAAWAKGAKNVVRRCALPSLPWSETFYGEINVGGSCSLRRNALLRARPMRHGRRQDLADAKASVVLAKPRQRTPPGQTGGVGPGRLVWGAGSGIDCRATELE